MAAASVLYAFDLSGTWIDAQPLAESAGVEFISTPGNPPNAAFAITPSTQQVNGPVTFDASASFAGAGATITSYNWTTGATILGSGQVFTLPSGFSSIGTKPITLVVTQDDGQTDTVSHSVSITSPSGLSTDAGSGLAFSLTLPTAPSTQTVHVTGGTLQFRVSNNPSWVTVSPSGPIYAAPQTLTIGIDPTGLSVGSYVGTVTLTPTDGISPQTFINVTAAVTAATVTTDLEHLTLDGLNLNDLSTYTLLQFSPPVPPKNPQWISGADADGAILARDPLVGNGAATMTVQIGGASRNAVNNNLAAIISRLEEAERSSDGVDLIWKPAEGTIPITFTVLSGELQPFEIDALWNAKRPNLQFSLTTKPYGYLPEYSGPVATSASNVIVLDIPNVPGDVPAEARIVVTDMAGQARRTVEVGAEYLDYDVANPWPLVLDSSSLTTTGFTGAYSTLNTTDPGPDSTPVVLASLFAVGSAVVGTGSQPHIGTFRVSARVHVDGQPTGNTVYVRLVWRAGENSMTTNDWVPVAINGQWRDEYLGTITIPKAQAGAQTWDGRIEAYAAPAGAGIISVDLMRLMPTEAGMGRAKATHDTGSGAVVGYDPFDGALNLALNRRTATAGGSWVTSGPNADFVGDGTTMARGVASDATPHFAILGTTAFTDTATTITASGGVNTAAWTGGWFSAAIARWTNSSNYVRAALLVNRTAPSVLQIDMITGGTLRTLNATYLQGIGFILAASKITIAVKGTGEVTAYLTTPSNAAIAQVSSYASELATGGSLASGRPGFADAGTSSIAIARRYEDFTVWQNPVSSVAMFPNRSLELRSDAVLRQGQSGSAYGRAPYRGSRFYLSPAGGDNRTTRIAVKASRNDIDTGADDFLTDSTRVAVYVRPRVLTVPHS